MTDYFAGIDKIRYAGPQSTDALAFKWYDKDRIVLGKRMEEHLRFAVCYWHTFCWHGFDVFGSGTFERPWQRSRRPDGRGQAKLRRRLRVLRQAGRAVLLLPRPRRRARGRDAARERRQLPPHRRPDGREAGRHRRQAAVGHGQPVQPSPLHERRRDQSRSGSLRAAPRCRSSEAMDATQRLGGANYVLWGGREGYETLLNTDLKRESAQLGRFLHMVVEHKHKIGFKGYVLIEPKPHEPTKHQYDYDIATVHGFLQPVRAGERGEGQHRGQPRDAGGPQLPARDRHRLRARHLRIARHEPRRHADRLGHRPVPQQPARDRARAVRHPAGRRLHAPAA